SFTTKEPSIYDILLTPDDDFFTAITDAPDGSLIGLEPGVYDIKDNLGAYVVLNIIQKSITLESTTGDPATTKVNVREIALKGTGAGVTLRGIEFDGAPAGGDYFVNLVGMGSDGEAATFGSLIVDNCIVRNMDNCFLRGNRGASNNDHKIDVIR